MTRPLDLGAVPAEAIREIEWRSGWLRGTSYFTNSGKGVRRKPTVTIEVEFECSAEEAHAWAGALADLVQRVRQAMSEAKVAASEQAAAERGES